MNTHEREDAADRWLNEAFKNYGKAQCRLGLETRILAALEARAAQRRRRWMTALAASAVVAFVVGLMSSLHVVRKSVPAQAGVRKPFPETVPRVANAVARPPDGESAKPIRRPTVRASRARRHSERPVFEDGKSYLTTVPQLEPEPLIALQETAPEVSIQDLGVQPIQIKELAPIRDMN